MLRRIPAILALLVLLIGETQAQYDPSFSHYWAMPTVYNPAAVGKQEKLNIVGAYNMSMTGFENNPRTMVAAADMPFQFMDAYHGVGGKFLNDQIGLFSHNSFALQYALKIKLFSGMLGIGVQAAMLSENFDGSKVETAKENDPAFATSELTGSGFDLGAGIYYSTKSWYAGASVAHALAPTIELGEKNELVIDRTYYLMAGGNIRLNNPLFTIHPSLLGRTDGVGYRADATVRMKYTHDKKVMYAGVGYSPGNSVTVYLGGNFHGISLGYSYEAYTNGISLGNGSHELVVTYQTDMNLTKKGRNRHQSVRIL